MSHTSNKYNLHEYCFEFALNRIPSEMILYEAELKRIAVFDKTWMAVLISSSRILTLVPVAKESSRCVRWFNSIATRDVLLTRGTRILLRISYYLYCKNRLSGAPLFLYSMCSTDKVLRFNELEVRALNTKPSVL